MTKKDYIYAAEIILKSVKPSARSHVRKAFIQFFKSDNPRFDAERFTEASTPPKLKPVLHPLVKAAKEKLRDVAKEEGEAKPFDGETGTFGNITVEP